MRNRTEPMTITHSTLKAFLGGALSEEENAEVQLYLAEHPDDPDILALLEGTFDSCRTEADASTMQALTLTRSRLTRPRKAPRRSVLWRVAAVAALLLAIPASLYIGYKLHKEPAPVAWNELIVPIAETRALTLPDGTVLTLGAGSRVTWPDAFTGAERQIFLEGEVTAKVTKDPDKPFIIRAGDVDVRVHGTTFNFKSYYNDTMVEMMLLEGSVSMDIPAGNTKREVRLTPGDIAQYDRLSGEVSLGKVRPESFDLYSENRSFCFFNIPLGDIAADLERSFGTKIVVADEHIVGRRFLAFFTNGESLDTILKLLAANGGLRVVRSGGVIYLYGK